MTHDVAGPSVASAGSHNVKVAIARLQAANTWLREQVIHLRLTDAEREAIEEAMRQVVESDCIATPHALEVIGTLRGLLERMK